MTEAVSFDPDLKLFLTCVRRQSLLDRAAPEDVCQLAIQGSNNEHLLRVMPDGEAAPLLKGLEWTAQQRAERRDGQDYGEDVQDANCR